MTVAWSLHYFIIFDTCYDCMYRDCTQRKLYIIMFHHIIHHILSLHHRPQISSWPNQYGQPYPTQFKGWLFQRIFALLLMHSSLTHINQEKKICLITGYESKIFFQICTSACILSLTDDQRRGKQCRIYVDITFINMNYHVAAILEVVAAFAEVLVPTKFGQKFNYVGCQGSSLCVSSSSGDDTPYFFGHIFTNTKTWIDILRKYPS